MGEGEKNDSLDDNVVCICNYHGKNYIFVLKIMQY